MAGNLKCFAWLSRLVMRSETVECHYDTIFGCGECWVLNVTETAGKFFNEILKMKLSSKRKKNCEWAIIC